MSNPHADGTLFETRRFDEEQKPYVARPAPIWQRGTRLCWCGEAHYCHWGPLPNDLLDVAIQATGERPDDG